MERNPFNFTLGRTLQALRRERGIRGSGDLAGKLGISATTYRLIEAGRAVLPAHCVPPLAEVLKVDLGRLAALACVAATLDHGDPDPRKRRARAQRIADQYPDLAESLDAVLAGDPADERSAHLLRRFMEASAPSDANVLSAAAYTSQISPFFSELLDSVVAQLAPAQPIMPLATVFNWIADRARQLRRVRCYLGAPRALGIAAGRESFVWDLLRNPYQPRFEVVVAGGVAAKMNSLVHQTLVSTARRNPFVGVDKLGPRVETMAKSIQIRDGDDAFGRAMEPFLEQGARGKPLPAVDETRNVWLLEYAPAAAPSITRLVAWVGFHEPRRGAGQGERRILILDGVAGDTCARAFETEWRRLERR